MKKIYIMFVLLFLIMIVLFISRDIFSKEEEYSLILLDNGNKEELKQDIVSYIDMLDNEIIPVSSYNYSEILSLNYDFLVRFAIFNILDNEDVYMENIKYLDNYSYIDNYGNRYNTNKYVSIDLIYDITDMVFGKRDYLILNEEFKNISSDIPLIFIGIDNFGMNTPTIDKIDDIDNGYMVYVKYNEFNLRYIYEFKKKDQRLVINNISIGE